MKYLKIALSWIVWIMFTFVNVNYFLPPLFHHGASSAFDMGIFLIAVNIISMYWIYVVSTLIKK
jgi:hypothetical protein